MTDGDLLIVNVDENASQAFIERVRSKIELWCKSKGMHHVEILINTAHLSITKVTVNDPVDEVIKGDSNG